jgi:hypothetical protein
MSVTIQAEDQTLDGRTLRAFVLDLLTERVTARDLIRGRVFQEVSERRARALLQASRGDEAPDAATAARQPDAGAAQLDVAAETARALAEFDAGRVLVLVGDEQLDDPLREVVVTPGTQVSFVRLVPLVGG